jgi:hypothetical protein
MTLKYIQKSVSKSINQKLAEDNFLKNPISPEINEFSKPYFKI